MDQTSQRASVPVQIIAGLMLLGGIAAIIVGVPLLLVFGLGIIPILIGVLAIKFAIDIFHLRKKGYNGAMVVSGIALVLSLLNFLGNGFHHISSIYALQLLYLVVVMGILYAYRDKFTA